MLELRTASFERDRGVWAALKLAALSGEDVVVPTTVLAQVWRGRASQALLSQALQHCILESFDTVAKAVGELCGKAGTSDICDAHVAIVATVPGGTLYTSDAKDLRRLIAARGRTAPVIVRC